MCAEEGKYFLVPREVARLLRQEKAIQHVAFKLSDSHSSFALIVSACFCLSGGFVY